jgi:sarcosine oxidase, subunit gamma
MSAPVRAAILPLGGAAADVSAQRIGLRLTGPRVRDVLAKGCSIDLHPLVFRRGSSAQTMLGLAGIIVLALSDAGDDYVVLVRSSFAGYLADWLLDAALEFTVPGAPGTQDVSDAGAAASRPPVVDEAPLVAVRADGDVFAL